jgi:hypothetical protein
MKEGRKEGRRKEGSNRKRREEKDETITKASMCVLLRYGGTGTLTRLCVRHLASNPKEQVPLFQVCLPRLSLLECCTIPASGFEGEVGTPSPLHEQQQNNNN